MSRSVLVTGGNRGIGRAVAETFRDEGDRVAITYRKEDPAIPGVLAVRCDVTDSEQVDAAFDEVEARHGASRCSSPTRASPPTTCSPT